MEEKAYAFSKIRISVEGVGELNPDITADYQVGELPEAPTLDGLFQWASEEAESIGLRVKAHPEHGKVLCSLMLEDERQVAFSDPLTLIHYITGIKIALQMIMQGEITCERTVADQPKMYIAQGLYDGTWQPLSGEISTKESAACLGVA